MTTALIFGHSSGLGRALMEEFTSQGHDVVGVSRSVCDVDSPHVTNLTADLSQQEEVYRVADLIGSSHASFDVAVFSAGILTSHEIEALDYDDMQELYKVNVFAPMILASRLLDLIKHNEADVVTVTSRSTTDYYPRFSEYSTAKAALQKFTKDLQKELLPTRSRVIEFCPASFSSQLYQRMTGDQLQRNEDDLMQVEDLAKLIRYLLELPKNIEISRIFVNTKDDPWRAGQPNS